MNKRATRAMVRAWSAIFRHSRKEEARIRRVADAGCAAGDRLAGWLYFAVGAHARSAERAALALADIRFRVHA